MTRLVLVGTSHRRAPVELRERVGFESRLGGKLAARLAAGDGEAVALSTCNRTELYLVDPDAGAAEERALAELAAFSGLGQEDLAPALYRLGNDAAALHLLRVAAGLDSLVPGEAQILGQVRDAYEAAHAAGSAGPILHRLFRQALRVGKRVRSETAIAENAASVSSAAAELAEQVFDDLRGRRALLLGAGKMAELAALSLVSRGVEAIVVANRSPENAARLARRFGGEAASLDGLEHELARVDVVLASTSSPGFVLAAEQVERAMRIRRGKPIFFVDIAVPRDLDPAINELDDCYLYDVDDLERVVAESMAGRREEAAKAEAIVAEEADAFLAWLRSLDVVPAITSLHALAEDIRLSELARAERRLGPLSPAQRRAVDALTTQIVSKLLHLPTVRMKEAAAGADGTTYADAVRHLFGLDADPPRVEGQ